MEITEVKIRRLAYSGRLRAVVSVTFDGLLAVHDIKVIEGGCRFFVAMPSRLDEGGVYRDIVHPINGEMRKALEGAVLEKYREAAADQPPAEDDK